MANSQGRTDTVGTFLEMTPAFIQKLPLVDKIDVGLKMAHAALSNKWLCFKIGGEWIVVSNKGQPLIHTPDAAEARYWAFALGSQPF